MSNHPSDEKRQSASLSPSATATRQGNNNISSTSKGVFNFKQLEDVSNTKFELLTKLSVKPLDLKKDNDLTNEESAREEGDAVAGFNKVVEIKSVEDREEKQ